jgi:hypothetical protein
MPETEVLAFRQADGIVPIVEWLTELSARQRKAYVKCLARIEMLATFGNQLRRPHADYLRDGVYELRIRHGRVNYRMLYGFQGSHVAVLTHGVVKEAAVPNAEIELAIERMALVRQEPGKHTAIFEV